MNRKFTKENEVERICPITITQLYEHPSFGMLEIPIKQVKARFIRLRFLYATKSRTIRFESPDGKNAIEIAFSCEDARWLAKLMLDEPSESEFEDLEAIKSKVRVVIC